MTIKTEQAIDIWVLTEEYNEYDQHGEYFIEAWPHKPSETELLSAGVEPHRVSHVMGGGGRAFRSEVDYDTQWYHLRKHK